MSGKIASLADLLRDQLGVSSYTEESAAGLTVDTTAAVLLKNRPHRLGLFIANLSATANIYIRPLAAASTTQGMIIGAGQWLSFNWRDDMDLLAYEFWAISDTPATPVYYLEKLINPINPTQGTP